MIKDNDILAWRRFHLKRSKLKTSAKTSALLAGFAMVAMVELQISNDPKNPIPPLLLLAFGIFTVLLISVHLLALMISICLLPSIESVCYAQEWGKTNPQDSPHDKMSNFIEIAWTFSNVLGIFLFLVEVTILCWAKFWEMNGPGREAAFASTCILIPVMIIFVAFALYFYRNLVKHNYERSALQIKELEDIVRELEKSGSIESNIGRTSFDRNKVIHI